MKYPIRVLQTETITRHRTTIVEVEATTPEEARAIVNEMIEREPDGLPDDDHWEDHPDSGGLADIEYTIEFA